MHEMSIAMQVLEAAVAAAQENAAQSVEEVHVAHGAMRLIVPEALRQAWELAAEGTIAAGAVLELTEVPLKGRCRECGREYRPSIDCFSCPRCGQADVEIVEGDEITLTSVVCRMP